METKQAEVTRVIRIREVTWLTGLSRSTIYDRINPTSCRFDPKFPRPFKLGGYQTTAVGWSESEIYGWLKNQMERP